MATLTSKTVVELEKMRKDLAEKIRAIDSELRMKKVETMASAAQKLALKDPELKKKLEALGVKFEQPKAKKPAAPAVKK